MRRGDVSIVFLGPSIAELTDAWRVKFDWRIAAIAKEYCPKVIPFWPLLTSHHKLRPRTLFSIRLSPVHFTQEAHNSSELQSRSKLGIGKKSWWLSRYEEEC